MGLAAVNLAQVKDAVADEYAKLWQQWFQPGIHKPARLEVNTDVGDGFRPRANRLGRCPLSEVSLSVMFWSTRVRRSALDVASCSAN